MQKGDRVRIHTNFGGCYDGKTGTIKYITTTDVKKADGVIYRWAAYCDGMYDVYFDTPANNGGREMEHDVFFPNELELI